MARKLSHCLKPIQLTNIFRKLWMEHVFWTRLFIISAADNLSDLQFTTNRLLRNPVDFANELSPYYGYETAKRFEKLLTDHLTIAAKLVNDAKAGNTRAADSDRRNWYRNADEIAAFLSDISPYWEKQKWQSLLYDHLRMTEQEATYRLNSQYPSDIAEFDQIENEALVMADYMTKGIRDQFKI